MNVELRPRADSEALGRRDALVPHGPDEGFTNEVWLAGQIGDAPATLTGARDGDRALSSVQSALVAGWWIRGHRLRDSPRDPKAWRKTAKHDLDLPRPHYISLKTELDTLATALARTIDSPPR